MRTGADGMQVLETPAETLAALLKAAEAGEPVVIAGREYRPVEPPKVEHYRDGPGHCACGWNAYAVHGIMLDYGDLLQAHLRTMRKRPDV